MRKAAFILLIFSALFIPTRAFHLFWEIGVDDFHALLQTVKVYLKPGELSRITDKPKVVVLLHGSGGGSYMFSPLIERLKKFRELTLITLDIDVDSDNPIAVQQLQEKLAKLSQETFKNAPEIDVALIGHSLGAHISGKYLWRTPFKDPKINLSLFVNIAGRLKDSPSDFSWFYQHLKPEIAATWDAMKRSRHEMEIYSIYGSKDDIVPEESVHSISPKENRLTVEGVGHLGVLYAEETLNCISQWIEKWLR